MRVEGARIRLDLPAGWEGRIDEGGLRLGGDGAIRPTLVHMANFPLPEGRGDFGGGATELMRSGDVFVALFEHDPEAVGTALFGAEGIPGPLVAGDFHPNALQRIIPGQSGMQRFFTHRGRAFCLYVVMGSHLDRADSLPAVNRVLASLEIDP